MLSVLINVLSSVTGETANNVMSQPLLIAQFLPACLFGLLIAPRKAAVKTEKADSSEGEKKTSAERKTSTEEAKDTKRLGEVQQEHKSLSTERLTCWCRDP